MIKFKFKFKFKWLLIGVFILLSGCSSEPMIQLSEENQAKLEEKRAQSSEVSNNVDADTISETAQTESLLDVPETVTLAELDPSSWTQLPEGTTLELSNYLPYVAYQLKQFSNESGSYTTYVDFFDESNRVMQVREIVGATNYVNIYEWSEQAIQLTARRENIALFENLTQDVSSTPDANLTLLSAPVAVGTTWSYDGTHTSQIVGLYESLTLGEQQYTEVVEVSTPFEAYDLRQYYASGDGLILTRYVDNAEVSTGEQFWQVTGNSHQVMMILNRDVAQPQTEGEYLLSLEKVPFAYQTNDSLARAFQRLFTDLGWITDDIVVNSLTVDEAGVANLDFSAGVVAAFNQHPSTETSIIPAIVTTVVHYFDVTQVRLTVNTVGLLPDTLAYPENGIYQVDASWLAN